MERQVSTTSTTCHLASDKGLLPTHSLGLLHMIQYRPPHSQYQALICHVLSSSSSFSLMAAQEESSTVIPTAF